MESWPTLALGKPQYIYNQVVRENNIWKQMADRDGLDSAGVNL